MKIILMVSLSALSVSGAAFAGCPDNLSAEKMAECITIEGSGANYQDWRKNEYLHNLEPNTDTASMVSPVTGKDVRTMQPAAGTSIKKATMSSSK